MDESKSQINVKCCVECIVICYNFSVMYGENSVSLNAYN
jgi:hypothetical protein